MNTKLYGILLATLVALFALAGCSFGQQQKYMASTACASGVMDTTTGECHTPENADRAANQAAGGTGGANIQVGNFITHTSGVFGVDVDDGIAFADQPSYETHPNGQMYITCADLEKVIGLKLDYANGGCHLRYQQHDVWVGYVPMPVYALGADNKTWGPCTGVEAGLHRGLSFYAAIPSLDILSDNDPRTDFLPHFDGVKLTCTADEMNAVLEEAANAGRKYQSRPEGSGNTQAAAPATAAPSANNEGAAPAAPQAVIDCPVVSGIQSTPLTDGQVACLWKPPVPIDFGAVPDGFTAENDTGIHNAGDMLGKQAQVLLRPLAQ